MKSGKSIVFVNQSSGYLMVDIINAHAAHYDEIVLLTGFLNPRNNPLNDKVKVVMLGEIQAMLFLSVKFLII